MRYLPPPHFTLWSETTTVDLTQQHAKTVVLRCHWRSHPENPQFTRKKTTYYYYYKYLSSISSVEIVTFLHFTMKDTPRKPNAGSSGTSSTVSKRPQCQYHITDRTCISIKVLEQHNNTATSFGAACLLFPLPQDAINIILYYSYLKLRNNYTPLYA